MNRYAAGLVHRYRGETPVRFVVERGQGVRLQVWPFEGREAELALIASALRETEAGAVVISGPAGSGKTRLARHALSVLDCAQTAWVGATQAAAVIPFGAVAPLVPESAPSSSPLGLIRAVARHVRGWGDRRRVVIGVDDAHLLDDASATLVAHLVTDRAACVIMTIRTGDPLADVLVRLCKDGGALRIELAPLPAQVVDRLIDHAAPQRLDALQRRRLHETSRGNPLALR